MRRRDFLLAGAAAGISTWRVRAQAPTVPPIAVHSLNHAGVRVPDVQRAVDFNQRIFGMPIQSVEESPTGRVANLRIGRGPQFLSFYQGSEPAAVTHVGIGIKDFDGGQLLEALREHGVRVESRTRKAAGGDVQELTAYDPDNVALRLQDIRYCGGSGSLGIACGDAQAPKLAANNPPIIAASTINHFSIQVSDIDRTVRFYQRVFGLPIQSVQPFIASAPVPVLGIGGGPQFLAFYGGGGAKPVIGHYCLGVDLREGFDIDRVTKMLADHGVQAAPRMRRARPPYNVREGLSFRAPMELYTEISDVSYCGGKGVVGSICP